MFTSPAPAAPTVSASAVSPASPPPRSTGLRGGLSFLRHYTHSLHPHAGGAEQGAREKSRSPASQTKSSGRSRAATTTPPISPSFASASSVLVAAVGRDPLVRTQTAPDPDLQSPSTRPPLPPATMTRNRADTAAPPLTVRNNSGPTPTSTPTMSSTGSLAAPPDGASKHLPSIRFIPHQDPRAARPSLTFPTITRTLPDESSIIRVGRYSERDNIPDIPANIPSAAAVGFKSKVVSRKHCELWCKDGNWYIKDVKSSSGTFLNHIRLSQPNAESKPFRLKDGDIIQLGIDFRGGEEMIFRCVKIRIECNRGWQQALNTFNKQTHQRLRNLGKAKKEGDNASTHTSECSICLMSIAPCQSLFVAPCSHVWHYKCIRPILNGPTWPNFLCPNCRAVTDLEADVDDPGDFEAWDDDVAQANEHGENGENPQEDRHVTPRASTNPLNAGADLTAPVAEANGQISFADLEAAISNINISESLNGIANQPVHNLATPQRNLTPTASSSVTQPVAINITGTNEVSGLSPLFQNGEHRLSPDRHQDGPMTPRNDAGPFVLDGSGSAGRVAGQRLRDGESPNPSSTSAPALPPINID